jgi:hypothetical protein
VTSVKIAASFDKKKAGVEDFLLALLRIPQEVWIYQFLDYLGISTKDVEQNLVNLNNNLRQFDPGSQP